MLLNLHVKNMALIKEIDVDFENGLIVFTGETGAGKSLLLGSVNVALGQKASKDMIRQGSEYSLVELTFCVTDNEAEKLKKLDIEMEDNIVTVTRKIAEGRSVSKINGETVNLNTLKEAMSMLIDIHGQHEHQSLLYTKKHLEILDTFAKDEEGQLPKILKTEYAKYLELKSKLEELNIDDHSRVREIEFAEYEISEIKAADLKPGEDEELEKQFRTISNSQDIVSALSNVYSAIGSEHENSAGECISKAIREIGSVVSFDEKIETMQNTLYEIDALCRDLSSEIYDYNSQMEFNPEDAAYVSERLDLINRFKLKYGKSIEEILAYADEKQKYLDKLNNLQFEIDEINKQIEVCHKKMEDYCDTLSSIRKKSAIELEKQITEALVDLNFLAVDFKINFSKKDNISENGYDNIEFLISTNPGEPLKPLVKVASGGELSRIMLALKSILAKEDEVNTLIFDEIDTGISGKTAQMVAEKLAKISKHHQVICISHLSQIAAMADAHYLIDKKIEDNSTYTNLKKLDRSDSIREIVRINGGSDVTEAALVHATEMKEMADRVKCNLS